MLYPLIFTKIQVLFHLFYIITEILQWILLLKGLNWVARRSQATSSGWCCRGVSGSGSSHRPWKTFLVLPTHPYLPVSGRSLRDMLSPESAFHATVGCSQLSNMQRSPVKQNPTSHTPTVCCRKSRQDLHRSVIGFNRRGEKCRFSRITLTY